MKERGEVPDTKTFVPTGKHYTVEKHTQILIALMKRHGVRKIIASPGTTNICMIGSLQSDAYFQIYSCVDERSAAFMAVGMAAESGEPVAIVCTGSTASRNYIPGLTEAFYRKLPVLAITTCQHLGRVGQYASQVIDRSQPLADIVNESVTCDCVYTPEDEWQCALDVNKALVALKKNGGGPAHINLVTTYNRDFSCTALPDVKTITHVSRLVEMPSLDGYRHIAILVGVHARWSDELARAVEDFCGAYNAVVVMNHASNYKGDYGYNPDLLLGMADYVRKSPSADLVIYIGGVSRYQSGMKEKELWRVNPDGIIRDFEKTTTRVFAMDEADFFRHYADLRPGVHENSYARQWQEEYQEVLGHVPELPFSNTWVAQQLSGMLPDGCVFHLAGSNTAREWNFFPIPKSVICHSNDGTMGIDGQVSAMVGESLASPEKIHMGAVGDLTFFYDMNSIGNRHITSNFRLMIVNNGKGAEFKLYSHPAYQFGEAGDAYMAAAGHFGDKSGNLIRHYAEDLGFEYLCASDKDSFMEAARRFTTVEMTERPMIFEVFTDSKADSDGLYAMNHLIHNAAGSTKSFMRGMIKAVAGEKGVEAVKGLLRK